MHVLAFDTETCLIRPALLAPEMVCLTYQRQGEQAVILHHSTAEQFLRASLMSGDNIFVGHNVAYDMAVLAARFPSLRPLIWRAYEEDRVTDTGIRQQLLDIAGGVYRGRIGEKGRWLPYKYSLQDLAKRCAGIEIQKDAWRLSYGEFLDTPLAGWPERAREVQRAAAVKLADVVRARLEDVTDKNLEKEAAGLQEMISGDPSRCTEYPLDDARATLAVYQAQEPHKRWLDDQFRQTRAAFWLHLSSAWGLRTDAVGVEILRSETQAAYDGLLDELVQLGLVRADGSRDTKLAKARMLEVCARDNLVLRRTDSHATPSAKCKGPAGEDLEPGDPQCVEHITLDADACNASDDDVLQNYAELSTLKKVLTNDVEALLKGIAYPVHTRYGLAETGRTTSSGPNIQNLRRKAGIREAFVPRPGKVFAQADYPQLELYTLAQCCVKWIGASKLADALNGGLDPHLAMAAQIVGVSYEEAARRITDDDIDNARQTAKVANFGFPGGLGVQKLCMFAKKTYGVDLTLDAAKRLKEQWFATWPEMPHYFARVNALCDTPDGRANVTTLFTNRVRGGASYCAACNNGFQALGSDCAKNAGWHITRALYTESDSPLFNSRLVAFVHDEFIIETDEGPSAHDAAHELARLMREGANVYLPDVKITAAKMKPLLMKRWSKKAKALLGPEGRLLPWS